MSYRYDDDALKMSIANYIISGIFFIAGVILIVIAYTSEFSIFSIGASLTGFGLYNLANVCNIYDEYNMSNKFVKFLLRASTIIGALLILLSIGASFSYNNEYGKVLAISIFLGCLLKIVVESINEIIPSIESPKGEFFKYCSLLIFIAGFLAVLSVLYIFFDFHYVLLLVGNWVLAYLVLSNVRSFMDEKTPKHIIMAIIFFLVGLGLNLGISLAVNGIANPQFDITKANLFNVASSLYFFLSIVLGIAFSFLTRIDYVKYNMSDVGVEILLLVIPLIAFGIQFLAFFYFNAFLIVAGVTFVIITLIVLLFKAFIAVVKFIWECITGIAKGVWYIITFKWVSDLITMLTPTKEDFKGPAELVADIEDAARLAAKDCGCSYSTLNGNTLYFSNCKCSKSQVYSALDKHFAGNTSNYTIEFYE